MVLIELGALWPATQPQRFIGVKVTEVLGGPSGGDRPCRNCWPGHWGICHWRTRQQQKLGTLDAIGGEDEGLSGDPMGLFIRVEIMNRDNASLIVVLDTVDHRIDLQSGPRLHRRLNRDAAVVLRINRANRLANCYCHNRQVAQA